MNFDKEIKNCLVDFCDKNVLREIEELKRKVENQSFNGIMDDKNIGVDEKRKMINHVNALRDHVNDFSWRIIELINALYPGESVLNPVEDFEKDTHK